MPKLYLLCGLPGSGKSTYAKTLSKKQNAIPYSSDEWLIKLFGRDFPSDKFKQYQNQTRKRIEEEASKEIARGKNIILDFGFWKKNNRANYIQKAKSWGAKPVIIYLKADLETLKKRLSKRNEDIASDNLYVSDEMLQNFSREFEKPSTDEAELVVVEQDEKDSEKANNSLRLPKK